MLRRAFAAMVIFWLLLHVAAWIALQVWHAGQALDERFRAGQFTGGPPGCPIAVYRDQAWPDCPAWSSYDPGS